LSYVDALMLLAGMWAWAWYTFYP